MLQFSEISIDGDYGKKWNIKCKDFITLTKNGKLVRDTLYRIGGLNTPKLNKDEYFMLIKHVEAFYSDDITKIKKYKPHFKGIWCILDKNGNEKIEFDGVGYPYLVDGSCIYSIDNIYYNIETDECYGNTNKTMESDEFLFLENRFNKNKQKRGVMKINKKNGSWELFKS